MRPMLYAITFLIVSTPLLISCGTTVPPIAVEEPEIVPLMEDSIATLLDTSEAQAVSLAVSYKGQLYITHGGEIDPGKQNTPDDETLFEIASITKTFTGILTADAVNQKLLTLEDDIRMYLDGDYHNLEYDGHPIRIKHLLTHTSGLPANNEGMQKALRELPDGDATGERWREIYGANAKETRASVLDYLGRLDLASQPGTKFNYSNFGTNLMAHILERVTGQSFGSLLTNKILQNADMTDSYLQLSPTDISRLALGYNAIGEHIPPLPIADILWGADGGIKATPHDMAKYMDFVLSGSAPSVELSKTRLHKLDEGYWMGYFWWVIDTETGERSYRHDGGGAGVRNVMIIYPSEQLGIYIVTNKANADLNTQLTTTVRSLREAVLLIGE